MRNIIILIILFTTNVYAIEIPEFQVGSKIVASEVNLVLTTLKNEINRQGQSQIIKLGGYSSDMLSGMVFSELIYNIDQDGNNTSPLMTESNLSRITAVVDCYFTVTVNLYPDAVNTTQQDSYIQRYNSSSIIVEDHRYIQTRTNSFTAQLRMNEGDYIIVKTNATPHISSALTNITVKATPI